MVRFKIFQNRNVNALEQEINNWFEHCEANNIEVDTELEAIGRDEGVFYVSYHYRERLNNEF